MTKGKIINNEVVFEKMPLSVNIYQIKKKKKYDGIEDSHLCKIIHIYYAIKTLLSFRRVSKTINYSQPKKKKSQRHEISNDFRYIICKFLNFNKYISFQIYEKKVIKLIIYYVVDELLIAFITISIYIYF